MYRVAGQRGRGADPDCASAEPLAVLGHTQVPLRMAFQSCTLKSRHSRKQQLRRQVDTAQLLGVCVCAYVRMCARERLILGTDFPRRPQQAFLYHRGTVAPLISQGPLLSFFFFF